MTTEQTLGDFFSKRTDAERVVQALLKRIDGLAYHVAWELRSRAVLSPWRIERTLAYTRWERLDLMGKAVAAISHEPQMDTGEPGPYEWVIRTPQGEIGDIEATLEDAQQRVDDFLNRNGWTPT